MSNVAPFIRTVQLQGGTMYTMSSASEDLGFSFNNDGKTFKFSKYALLNIPDIKRPTFGPLNHENFVQLDTIPGAFQYVDNSKTQNMILAESFQNYVLNLETMFTQSSNYDANLLQTVSERVFFKWLKEIGALRFREATTTESPLTAGLRFTEEDSSNKYNRVVQYIGEIDVVNSVKNSADAFSEVYIHVPTKDGATPLVLFKSLNDINYQPGQNLINIPTNPINTDYIVGRNIDSINPAGLNKFAFFDSPSSSYGQGATVGSIEASLPSISTPGEYQLLKYDIALTGYSVGWWFSYPEAHSYWTQPSAITGNFDDPQNDSFKIKGVKEFTSSEVSVSFQRSRLDGIMLDFDTTNYYPIASNPALNTFSDFNSLPSTNSFDFNVVLVYYDIINISTNETATNLFGVLFLDNVEDTLSGGGTITRLTKFKPNTITGLNGNSFGFKVNLKFDISAENTAIVTSVNEYAPFSMQLFVDALNELQSAADSLNTQNVAFQQISTEISTLQGLVYDNNDLEELNQRLTVVEQQLLTAGAIFDNSSTVLGLIQRNYEEILNIYNNKTSVTVSYNTDTIVSGDGIILDKSVPNRVSINNVEQGYSVNSSPVYNLLNQFTNTPSAWVKEVSLLPYANYFKINNGAPIIVDRDIYILVNDSQQTWKAGQIFKIVVDHNYPMDMYSQGSFDLIVYTDASDKLNTGQAYSSQIGRISSNEFYSKGGHAQLEIICIDSVNYQFTFDVI